MGKLTHTVKAPIASFRSTDVADIDSLKIHFLPVQAGSGDASPENQRPITGWTSCNLFRAKKNLLNFNKWLYNNPQTLNGITFTQYYNADGSLAYINAKGTRTSTNAFYNLNYFQNTAMTPGHYIVSGNIPGKVEIYAFEYNPNEARVLNTATGVMDFVAHAGASKSWIRLQIVTADYIDVNIYPMLKSYPNSDTTYEKYQKETIPVSWSTHGVEYGGYIDIVRGKLVAEYKAHVFNGEETINDYPGTFTGGIRLANDTLDDCTGSGLTKCDKAVLETSVPSTISRLGIRIGGGKFRFYFFVPDSMFNGEATAEKFKAWLSENNMTVVAKLIEPIEYDLTPQQIQTYLDYNNFWSDTNDDVEVEYEFADVLLKEKRAIMNARNDGKLVFWLNAEDAPVNDCWVDRIRGINFSLYRGAYQDVENNVYDFTDDKMCGFSLYSGNPNRTKVNFGHHFRMEFDTFYRRTNSGIFFDIGSLTNADKAIGLGFASSTSNNLSCNWKMEGNNSNPWSVTGEARTHPNMPEVNNPDYEHLTGFFEIIDGGDGYDRLRIKLNDKIIKYYTQIPKAEYAPEWYSQNKYFTIGAGVYNYNQSSQTSTYYCNIKIREIKVYQYD